jgi:hypothetical protein
MTELEDLIVEMDIVGSIGKLYGTDSITLPLKSWIKLKNLLHISEDATLHYFRNKINKEIGGK